MFFKTRQANYFFLDLRKGRRTSSGILSLLALSAIEGFQNLFKRSRIKYGMTIALILSIIFQSLLIFPNSVYAASSPWTQTDWSGGSGQTAWSDTTKYSSTSGTDTSATSGQATLTNTEQLANTGFESNLSSWLYSADQTLTTSGNEITDASRTTNTSGDGITPPDSSFGIWQAATNLLSNGGFETNTAGWSAIVSGSIARITTDSKFGAAALQLTIGGTDSRAVTSISLSGVSAGTVYTASTWVKAGSADAIGDTFFLRQTESGGATGNQFTDASIVLTDQWQRVTLSRALLQSDRTSLIVYMGKISGGVVGHVYSIDGVQLETGSVATPYIETNGSTAARSAARVRIPITGQFTAQQGWVAARIRPGWAATNNLTGTNINPRVFSHRPDASNWIELYFNSTSDKWEVARGDSSGYGTLAFGSTSTHAAGDTITLIYNWEATQIKLSVNGSAFVTTSNSKNPTLTDLPDIGRIGPGVSQQAWLMGDFLWFAAGSGTLSDSDASTINGFGNTDPTLGSLPSSANTTAIWAADTSTYTAGSVARDTSTTYSSSASSAKVISSQTTGNFTQSVNVGDTNTYNLSAYAYTDGSAVTASDLSLFYNGSTIPTTYTSVGGGWYKLSGTLTGANASRNYGVQVASGKTVYVDNFSLNRYATLGTLTSSIFDAENTNEGNNWGALTYSSTTPTNTQVSVKARTSNDSGMSGATDFSSCSAITTGSDISSNSCVTDGHRYIQYQVTLSATDTSITPTFQDISIAFSQRDTTGPVLIELDSPGDNSYTSNERPTFRWKATSDATSGLSKYVLEIDNPIIGTSEPSGDFTINDIPISRTTNYETNKYIIRYENFDDSDSTNNYISVYTKSHSDWGTNENDGKLREGKVRWKLKAVDNSGNESSSSRTLFVDKTNPGVEFGQVNSTPYSSNGISTTSRTPTIFGKITDTLAGGDSSQTQDENGPKVASGPKEVNIKVEKKEGLIYKLITLYTINVDKQYYTCDDREVSDNSKQNCSKYMTFKYTPEQSLEQGVYKITLSGKDKADNTSSEASLTLNIGTFDQIATLEEKEVFEEKTKDLQPEEKEKVQQELEITKPVEPNVIEKTVNIGGNFISTVFTGIGNGAKLAAGGIGSGIAFIFDTTGQVLAFRNEIVASIDDTTREIIGSGLTYVTQGVGSFYNNIAYRAPGITKDVLLAVGDGFSATGNFIGDTTSNVEIGTHNAEQAVTQGFNNIVNGTRDGIANAVFVVGQKTEDVSHGLGTAIIKIGYLFVPEPTTISNVKVAKSTPTSMTITWKTNHPATGKVNYGLTEDYGQDIQSDKRLNNHEFTIIGLKPNTTYYYEVMSQNRNYVYDARHTFTTPAE